MSVPNQVVELVERFRRFEAVYRSGQYNETQVRREFIDPFFECLGHNIAPDDFKAFNTHILPSGFSLHNSAFILLRTATDRQMDQLVYALYGLTVEEIALVEGER